MKKIRVLDCAVIGFALFGMFFGAGNLIFPPFLGLESQGFWSLGFVCFLAMDLGLAIMAILSVSKNGEDARCLTNHLGTKVSKAILIITVFCLGPLIAVPRTAATSFEFSVKPIFGDGASWIFITVFFVLAVALSIHQSQIITIIGAVLAPTMFISLVFLIFKGLSMPNMSEPIATEAAFVVREGINAGYQTMDIMGGIIFASSIIAGTVSRGYSDKKQRFNAILFASLITISALGVVYGGLCFLGSKMTDFYGADISRTELLSKMVTRVLGDGGNIFLGILVLSACLTAAIGILSSCSALITNITDGRLSYRKVLFTFAFAGFFLSNLGTEKIMSMAVPILGVICPVLLTIIVLGFFANKIKSDMVYKSACFTAFILSALSSVSSAMGIELIIDKLPFAEYGFGWIVPTAVVAVLASIKYRNVISNDTFNKPVVAEN